MEEKNVHQTKHHCCTVRTLLYSFASLLTCINVLLVAKMPMLEFGSTWRARVQRRLTKARARCWETCFLRLVSMTSRHWRTISTPSFVAPKTADIPFGAVLITFSLCNFTELRKNPRRACCTCPTSFPYGNDEAVPDCSHNNVSCTASPVNSKSSLTPSLT